MVGGWWGWGLKTTQTKPGREVCGTWRGGLSVQTGSRAGRFSWFERGDQWLVSWFGNRFFRTWLNLSHWFHQRAVKWAGHTPSRQLRSSTDTRILDQDCLTLFLLLCSKSKEHRNSLPSDIPHIRVSHAFVSASAAYLYKQYYNGICVKSLPLQTILQW